MESASRKITIAAGISKWVTKVNGVSGAGGSCASSPFFLVGDVFGFVETWLAEDACARVAAAGSVGTAKVGEAGLGASGGFWFDVEGCEYAGGCCSGGGCTGDGMWAGEWRIGTAGSLNVGSGAVGLTGDCGMLDPCPCPCPIGYWNDGFDRSVVTTIISFFFTSSLWMSHLFPFPLGYSLANPKTRHNPYFLSPCCRLSDPSSALFSSFLFLHVLQSLLRLVFLLIAPQTPELCGVPQKFRAAAAAAATARRRMRVCFCFLKRRKRRGWGGEKKDTRMKIVGHKINSFDYLIRTENDLLTRRGEETNCV